MALGYMIVTKSSNDFRDWDIAPESSIAGIDANGFPFYVWRESADNRLTLARPRYCCITPNDGELYFTFFNPSEDTKASGGYLLFAAVGILVGIAILGRAWFNPAPPLPYHFNENPPPFLILLGALFTGSLFGGIAGGVCHVVVTLMRWIFGRFSGEGRLYTMPLRDLSSFNTANAGEVGAKINGEEAKTGHGLTAVFEDNSMIILTGNAWNYRSIVDKHRDLTRAFRAPRDEILAEWTARQKKTQPKPVAGTPSAPQGLPDSL